jgi:hypothetical protein
MTADALNVDLNAELDRGLTAQTSKHTLERDAKRAKFVQELVLSTLL